MTELEFTTYTQIYGELHPLVDVFSANTSHCVALDEISWRADYTVYIDTPPIDCLHRIRQRKRQGETGITLQYLDAIERLHLSMLTPDIALSGLRPAVDNAAEITVVAMEKVKTHNTK